MESMPQPKSKKGKKKKKEEEPKPDEDGASPKKAKKKKKGKAQDLPPPVEWQKVKEMTVQEQMMSATNWASFNKIQSKQSAGNLTTATYHQKASQFDKQYEDEVYSPIKPQSTYFGQKPDPKQEDPFMRRRVKQLNDVDLIEDKEPEELLNLKRLPSKVLTEENLVRILSSETDDLCLENHYWLSTKFIGKLGMMAPNLTQLSLRRMPIISNITFADIFRELHSLENVDLAECTGLYSTALQLCLRNNENISALQLSGCYNAVDDTAMRLVSGMKKLTFIDISYSRVLTDKGFSFFAEKTTVLQSVILNGCPNISSTAVIILINSCQQTLLDFECVNNDQESMKNDLLQKLALCWNLENLDVTGCQNLDDQGFSALAKGEVQLRAGFPPVTPGLLRMLSVKVGLTKLTDYGLQSIIKACPNLHHLELNRCELTDTAIKWLGKDLPNLKFVDLTSVAGVTLGLLDEIKQKKPELLLRQFATTKFDPKDNGLRVPRRVIEKEKKKGKKKK